MILAISYRFLHLWQGKVDDPWKEKVIKHGRVTWTFGKWPRFVQSRGALTADRNTWTRTVSVTEVPVDGKKNDVEGSFEGPMISREASAIIVRDEINVASYEIPDAGT